MRGSAEAVATFPLSAADLLFLEKGGAGDAPATLGELVPTFRSLKGGKGGKGASKYRGLRYEKTKDCWSVRLMPRASKGGSQILILSACFPHTPEGELAASKYYDEGALRHYGRKAKLNHPSRADQIPSDEVRSRCSS